MKIGVLIPAYNAEKTLISVFQRIPKSALRQISEFIVINDGSQDNTKDIIKKLSENYPIKLINHKYNKGYGTAQKTGFHYAIRQNFDMVILLHSDGQYPPELIPELINPIMEGRADIVCGSRFLGGNMLKQGMPLHKYLGNLFLTSLINIITKQELTSYHSGYKAYTIKSLRMINYKTFSDYFNFDTEMLIAACNKNLKILEIPIPTKYGREKSYLNSLKYGIQIFITMINHIKGKYS